LTAPHPPYGCARPWYDMYVNATLPPRRPHGTNKPDYHAYIRSYRNLTDAAALDLVAALYLGCVSYSDAVFGMLLDTLQATGVYNNTAVFVLRCVPLVAARPRTARPTAHRPTPHCLIPHRLNAHRPPDHGPPDPALPDRAPPSRAPPAQQRTARPRTA
jgi:hypothetical protein